MDPFLYSEFKDFSQSLLGVFKVGRKII